MANAVWIGTISSLTGVVLGGGMQWWRDHASRKADLRTRWDKTILDGLAEYLAVADLCLRSQVRLHGLPSHDPSRAAALQHANELVEIVHEKGNLVALLAGDHDSPIRVAARRMRDLLARLYRPARDNVTMDQADVNALLVEWRIAREEFIAATQKRYADR
jgi:hypothetical protein